MIKAKFLGTVFHQKTYTLSLFETKSCEHIQEHFQILSQRGDFAATQGCGWISQRLELSVAKFPRPLHRRVEWGCVLTLPFPRQHLSPTEKFPGDIQFCPNLIALWYWYPTPVLQRWREPPSSIFFFLSYWEWLINKRNDCPKTIAFETNTISILTLSPDVLIWGKFPFLFNGMTFLQTWRLFLNNFFKKQHCLVFQIQIVRKLFKM